MGKGFIAIHRQILEWEWYDDINVFRVFTHLLLKANFEDKKWRGIDIKRGQLIIGREELARQTSLSIQKVRTALKKLETTNEITIKTTNGHHHITIEKYWLYQDKNNNSNHQNNQQLTNDQPTSNQRSTNDQPLLNNENNENKEKKTKQKKDFEIPKWIDQQLWILFMEIRKKKKAVQTTNALMLIIKDLEKIKESGHDPNESIQNSITNSWKGVFEPQSKPPPLRQITTTIDENGNIINQNQEANYGKQSVKDQIKEKLRAEIRAGKYCVSRTS